MFVSRVTCVQATADKEPGIGCQLQRQGPQDANSQKSKVKLLPSRLPTEKVCFFNNLLGCIMHKVFSNSPL